jgi:very-short-patch-repair endonuclease
MSAMLKQSPATTRLIRNLRKRESWGERLMWSWLRNRRFAQYKFRRQHPIGPYILDFFCREAQLNIEVDGFQHGSPSHREEDAARDEYLKARGIKVLRFWSSHLRREREAICNTIWQTLQERAPHPKPPYCRAGGARCGGRETP